MNRTTATAEHMKEAARAGSPTGRALRLVRLTAGMTLNDVSAAAGVDADYLERVESGAVHPRSEWVFVVCDAIGEHIAQSDA